MSANPAEIGIFTGTVLLLAPLIPVWRLKMAKKNKKNIKTVFYEPTVPMMFLWYIPAVCVMLLLTAWPYAIPGYEAWIMGEIERDTYWSGLIMILHMFVPFYGPLVIYGYYIFLRYDKVVQYQTPEWYEYRKSLK